MKITNLAIDNRISTNVLMFIIIIMGAYSYISMPKEASPDITIPYIVVSTPYFGVSPEDIENLVTRQIERELKGLSDVEEIRSTSQEGFSMITVEFIAGTDVDDALQKVREKVDLARPDLPEDAEDPVISEINFSDLPIMLLNISGRMDLVGLKRVAENLEDHIETIPGVIDAQVTGGLTHEVQVNIDPDRLNFYDVGLQDVIDAIRDEHLTIPGGTIELGEIKYLVRVPGEFTIPERLADIVIKAVDGRPVYLRDLAEVSYSFEERESISRLNGVETVSLSITKRSGTNLLEIADRVKQLIEQERQSLPEGIEIAITGDRSKDIVSMVNELENNVISGLLLVVLVLFVVMGLRNSLLVGVAIPLSMLLSFLVLQAMGETMNMVVLFSLIMAVGMLVDNAIVIVENIYRHHQEGLPVVQATRVATAEVGMAVTSSTLTTVVAFFPMLFWPGIMGEFMFYLPLTLIITLTSSLFVALVFNPTICSRWLRVSGELRHIEPRREALGGFMRHYFDLLTYAVRRPVKTLLASFGTLVLVIIIYGAFNHGTEFFPLVDPNVLYVDVTAPPGTSLGASDRLVRQVEEVIATLPDIDNVTANVGTQGTSMDFSLGQGTTNKSRVMIDLLDNDFRTQPSPVTRDTLRRRLQDITGAEIEVNEEEHGPPTGPPINIEISGDDYQLLGELARQVGEQIQDIPGVVDIEDDFEEGKPELRVSIDREQAALLGLNTRDIATTIRTAINGTEAAKYRVGEDEYDITVRFRESQRRSIEDLRQIKVFQEGSLIPLTNMADVEVTGGLGTIQHKDMKRVVTVGAKVEGRNENAALAEAQQKLAGMQLPGGYLLEFTGQNEEQEESMAFLSKAFVIALLLIALVLISQFNSLVIPFIIMFSVVLSLIGVLIGLLVTGTSFGIIMTGIGVISLAGVVVNNAIVLLDYTQKLRMAGFSKEEAVVQAGLVRLRPVLLTAVTTILGLVPLATGIGFDFIKWRPTWGASESTQWWGPMAIAVIFGLGFATILTLVVVPSMYRLLTDITDRLGMVPAYQRKMHLDEAKERVHPGTGIIE